MSWSAWSTSSTALIAVAPNAALAITAAATRPSAANTVRRRVGPEIRRSPTTATPAQIAIPTTAENPKNPSSSLRTTTFAVMPTSTASIGDPADSPASGAAERRSTSSPDANATAPSARPSQDIDATPAMSADHAVTNRGAREPSQTVTATAPATMTESTMRPPVGAGLPINARRPATTATRAMTRRDGNGVDMVIQDVTGRRRLPRATPTGMCATLKSTSR